jgi:hypothetical protein
MSSRRALAALAALVLLAAGCATPPGGLKPMPVRALELHTDCAFTDETGYAVSARVQVRQAEMIHFAATVSAPPHGSCRFDGPFRQVRRLPHVELVASDGCRVSLWEQEEQVTIAFNECARRCTPGAFDYVWPIIVDRSDGQCH